MTTMDGESQIWQEHRLVPLYVCLDNTWGMPVKMMAKAIESAVVASSLESGNDYCETCGTTTAGMFEFCCLCTVASYTGLPS